MMTETTDSNPVPPSDSNRRGLLAVVGLLSLALVVGAVVVGKSAFSSPAKATAKNVTAESVEAALEAAQVYNRDKKYTEAVTILEKLTERAPTDQTARLLYAQALMGQQKFPQAFEQYEAALALSNTRPASSGSKYARDPVAAQLNFEAGTCANMAGRMDRALELYWMAQTLDPTEPRYPLFLAMMQIKQGDDAAANASLLRSVKLNPDLAEGWGTMAELAVKQNRLSLGAQHLEKARTLQPEVARWRIVEARILNRNGDAEKAATILLSLDASTRADKQVIALLSESYGLLKRPMDAAKLWADAAKANGSDAELHYQAALWFQKAGDMNKAANHAQTAAMLGHEGAKQLIADVSGQNAGARD